MVRIQGDFVIIETFFSMVVVQKTKLVGYEVELGQIKIVFESGNVGIIKYAECVDGKEAEQEDSRTLLVLLTGSPYPNIEGPTKYHFRDARLLQPVPARRRRA